MACGGPPQDTRTLGTLPLRRLSGSPLSAACLPGWFVGGLLFPPPDLRDRTDPRGALSPTTPAAWPHVGDSPWARVCCRKLHPPGPVSGVGRQDAPLLTSESLGLVANAQAPTWPRTTDTPTPGPSDFPRAVPITHFPLLQLVASPGSHQRSGDLRLQAGAQGCRGGGATRVLPPRWGFAMRLGDEREQDNGRDAGRHSRLRTTVSAA